MSAHRVSIYIDGTNLGINLAKFVTFHVNMRSLSEALAKRVGGELECVKFYAAPHPEGGSEARSRQEAFFSALRHDGVELVMGRHVTRQDEDGNVYHQEKETDVNLAADLVADAFTDGYDTCVIVSGDTDFVRAAHQAKRAGKRAVWAHLPFHQSERMSESVDHSILLSRGLLGRCRHVRRGEEAPPSAPRPARELSSILAGRKSAQRMTRVVEEACAPRAGRAPKPPPRI